MLLRSRFTARFGLTLFACLSLCFCVLTAHAAEANWISDPNGCKVWNPNPIAGERITWSGNCKDGVADGPGTVTWIESDGTASTSEGPYLLGRITGHAIETDRGGNRFEGELVNGEKTGPGATRFADGASYVGNYVNDLENGKGMFTWASGMRYEGNFIDNRATGKGVLTWPNGDRYEGDVVEAHMRGKGVLVKADGTRQEGDFNGIWIPPEMAAWIVTFEKEFGASLARISLSRPEASKQGVLRGTADADGNFTWKLKTSTGWPEYDAAALDMVRSMKDAQLIPLPNYTFDQRFRYDPPQPGASYGIWEPGHFSPIRHQIVKTGIPPEKSYAELTVEQQNALKSLYEPMATGDEPPYPLYGTRPILIAVQKVHQMTNYSGALNLDVTIDSTGKPTQVAILQAPDDETGKAVATILMLQKYKPAICAGVPCKMLYPFRITLVSSRDEQ